MNVWYSFFFDMRPGRPLPDDLAQKGPLLVLIAYSSSWYPDGFILDFWKALLGVGR